MENSKLIIDVLVFSMSPLIIFFLMWTLEPTRKNVSHWIVLSLMALFLHLSIYLAINVGKATFCEGELFGSMVLSWGLMMHRLINKTKDKNKRKKECFFGIIIFVVLVVLFDWVIEINFKPVEDGPLRAMILIFSTILFFALFIYEFIVKNISLND